VEDDTSEPDRSRSGLTALLLFRRPKDAVSLCLAVAATATILVNALFWQKGPHPAPIFANLAQPVVAEQTPSIAGLPRKRAGERDRSGGDARSPEQTAKLSPAGKPGTTAPPAAPSGRDPISELLEPSNRMMAVQRVLSDFGYGQIRPTGVAGPETKAAIEKFEREHKMPVTGQMSERLSRELAAMKGGPL
jgi:hypothetical protein